MKTIGTLASFSISLTHVPGHTNLHFICVSMSNVGSTSILIKGINRFMLHFYLKSETFRFIKCVTDLYPYHVIRKICICMMLRLTTCILNQSKTPVRKNKQGVSFETTIIHVKQKSGELQLSGLFHKFRPPEGSIYKRERHAQPPTVCRISFKKQKTSNCRSFKIDLIIIGLRNTEIYLLISTHYYIKLS